MKKKLLACVMCGLFALAGTIDAKACTAIYVGKEASDNGSAYIARSEDLEKDHNKIFKVVPAKDYPAGATYVDPYGYTMHYPTHTLRHTIIMDDPEIEGVNGLYDYPEVGFNEKGVYVTATVSTKYHDAIQEKDPLVDTGIAEMSMAEVMLQEATSAKHAMEILAREVKTKGAAECNIILASDKNETWMMEIVSGHQYAAVKLQDDEVAVIPNCMVLDNVGRYRDFIVSDGLLETALEAGTAKFREGQPETVENLLVAESYSHDTRGIDRDANKYRFWGGLNLISSKIAAMFNPERTVTALPNHQAFVHVSDLDKKLSLRDVMDIEAYRYEGTKYDTDKTGYRAIGADTQMEIHIAEMRSNMEDDLSGIQWQAFANGEFTVYIPYFTNLITDTHKSYQVLGNSFNEESYYWNFERVMQLCATDRTNYGAPVRAFWKEYQEKLFARQKEIDFYLQHTPVEKRSEVATRLGMEMAEDVFTTEVTIRKQLEAHIHDHPGTLFVIKDIDQELPELVYEAADYTEVDRALQVVAGLKKTDYEDFSAVDAAVAAVVRGKNFTQQDEVDAMAKAINDAVAKLVKKAPTTEGGSTNTGNQGVASPNTGDETQPMLFVGMLLLAGASIVMLRKKATRE